MTCKHLDEFIHWEDHSKPIFCCQCEIERLRGELAAARRTIVYLWQRSGCEVPDGTVAVVRKALEESARAAGGDDGR